MRDRAGAGPPGALRAPGATVPGSRTAPPSPRRRGDREVGGGGEGAPHGPSAGAPPCARGPPGPGYPGAGRSPRLVGGRAGGPRLKEDHGAWPAKTEESGRPSPRPAGVPREREGFRSRPSGTASPPLATPTRPFPGDTTFNVVTTRDFLRFVRMCNFFFFFQGRTTDLERPRKLFGTQPSLGAQSSSLRATPHPRALSPRTRTRRRASGAAGLQSSNLRRVARTLRSGSPASAGLLVDPI